MAPEAYSEIRAELLAKLADAYESDDSEKIEAAKMELMDLDDEYYSGPFPIDVESK